jgi:hypothetical protein
MRGKLSFMTVAEGIVSIWDEGSSQERASMRAMRASMIKRKGEGFERGRLSLREGTRVSRESFFKEKMRQILICSFYDCFFSKGKKMKQ